MEEASSPRWWLRGKKVWWCLQQRPLQSLRRGGCSGLPELASGCRGRRRRQARTRLARSAQPSALQLQPLCPAGFEKKRCCGSDALSWLRFVMVPETPRPLQLVLRDYHMTEAEGLAASPA